MHRVLVYGSGSDPIVIPTYPEERVRIVHLSARPSTETPGTSTLTVRVDYGSPVGVEAHVFERVREYYAELG